ncbi:RagB/SusD family nutrient uptake outer membrane protein [Lutibacter sp. A80]|uniref:RagB/SusD family nutrient uptake outer membrane protein n=1 Tax=Lutibacter sp. A80 TaxID=2918453 RepID=UPI001F05D790|nr:RagB/SusD family nutrient uptake outer membrane protein [Lutibacter sp. A80]UMB61829.1 RagB/SusD family nutrient uptake outer membrane protein [Lutibacter sp. A80]
MKNILNKLIFIVAITFSMTACHDDLDQAPIDPDSFTEKDVFANANEAKKALAKVYASFALTGQEGPSGQPDIADIDEGFSQYTRMLFNLNELTTDHAVVGWGDPGLPDLHGLYWSSSNDFTEALYSRLAQGVSFSNSFIKIASDLTEDEVQYYIAEARFLRAFAYYNLMDLYGNIPLTTEISTELPTQSNRTEIFAFVESELLEIQELLKESGTNEYGRVDRVAAWALLSKLYLNAEVWTGDAKYSECVTYSEKVINSSYSINTNDANGNGSAYDELFLADNDVNGAQNEFIFTANFDGLQSQTYGGSTFLIHAAIGGTMDATKFGVNGGWGGLRTTKALVNKFKADVTALNNALGSTSDWGLVGDATANSWDGPDMEMYETSTNKYELYADLNAGEMKFRFNEDWGVNFGDTDADGTLETDGTNIAITNPGTYYILLDLNTNTYSIEPYQGDRRAMFHSDGQNLEIESIPTFEDGYAVTKFKNIDSNGNQGSDAGGDFTDTDLPLIRLAEIYLNYAEATLRGGGGDLSYATSKINELRTRAYGNTSGNVNTSDIDLDFVLDERSRELYWEGQRRTDLVRYNYFTTDSYLWPFKGNEAVGISVGSHRNLFPLPVNVLSTNPNLTQNQGY